MKLVYYAVYLTEKDTVDPQVGLFRLGLDAAGDTSLTECHHPEFGWSHTGYWVDLERGEPEDHLVEVDEDRAAVVRAYFDAKYAGPDRPQWRPRPPSRIRETIRGVLGREPREG